MLAVSSNARIVLPDIRQIAASFSLMLRHFGLLRNPEAPMRLVDGRRAGPTPFSEWGRVEFSLIETHLSCKLERTHDNRTPYAVDVTGSGRSSAMSRSKRRDHGDETLEHIGRSYNVSHSTISRLK